MYKNYYRLQIISRRGIHKRFVNEKKLQDKFPIMLVILQMYPSSVGLTIFYLIHYFSIYAKDKYG